MPASFAPCGCGAVGVITSKCHILCRYINICTGGTCWHIFILYIIKNAIPLEWNMKSLMCPRSICVGYLLRLFFLHNDLMVFMLRCQSLACIVDSLIDNVVQDLLIKMNCWILNSFKIPLLLTSAQISIDLYLAGLTYIDVATLAPASEGL